tara:strand:+ start:201 stop:530 length:330 start_codon:yes stop_codon:yes gene_type:complete
MKVEVTIEIDDSVVMSAVESGLRYIGRTWGEVKTNYSVMGTSWDITENDPDLPDAGKPQRLGYNTIRSGIKWLALDEPAEYAKLMTGNADEHTGSLIVQYALWSDSRYV